MGKIQIWQQEGCGTDETTLLKVLNEFREDGVQGLNSAQCLTEYIKRIDVNRLARMYEMDADATLQIMIDCVGAAEAFKACLRFSGWISPQNYKGVCQKYDDRVAKAQTEADNAQNKYFEALREKDKLEEQIAEMEYKTLVLKAKLYDTYEAMNKPTDKNMIKGEFQPCRARTEKTPSGSLE